MRPSTELRMVATLGVAGTLSGLALVGIFVATAPTIARNRAEALEKAIVEVVPGAARQAPNVVRGDELVEVDSPGKEEDAIYAAYGQHGGRLGFAVPAKGSGFQGDIALIYGIDPTTRRLTGMRVLESIETPGLGDKIVKDEAFVQGFVGVAVDPRIVAVKKGSRKGANEIDAISGATISSKAVVRIINESVARWLPHLPAEESP